jgi:hypothetical protein
MDQPWFGGLRRTEISKTPDIPMHIVLLGDSVFDNAAYTGGGPAVIDHLRVILGPGDEATLLAVDGHRVVDIPSQARRAPAGGTHFFLSVGGNDALDHISLLAQPVRTVAEGLAMLGAAAKKFEARYRAMVRELTSALAWLQVCTIYNGDFGSEEPFVSPAVRLFDDAIQRVANAFSLEVIELRDLLNEPGHYANAIEPGVEGGRVLAGEIFRRTAR